MNHHRTISPRSLAGGSALLLALLCQITAPPRATAADAEPADALKRVTEIGIEHTPCYGTCPVYTAVFAADGTVRYTGEEHVDRMGKHTGKVPKEKFEELAKLILDSGFLGLKDDYSEKITDQASVIATVTAGGERKSVRDYGHAGPKELADVERRIDALLAEVKWDPDQPAKATAEPPSGKKG